MKTKQELEKAGVVFLKPWERLSDYEKAGISYLSDNGLLPIVRKENPTASANIDLQIDGELWELKNITNISSSVGNQLGRVRKKWWKLGLTCPMRVVFTTENATDSYDAIVESLKSRMHPTDAFIVFDRDGAMDQI